MIRYYNSPGWVMYVEFPGTGFLLDIMCMICAKQATVLVEPYWQQFRKVRFMCRQCGREIGSAIFKKKK